MTLRYEKNIRIVTDLLGHCHFLGGDHLQMDMRLENAASYITVKAEVKSVSAQQLAEINKVLNIPRQREMEQNYWNISGEEEIDGELMLVGVMVDNATVVYENGWITFEVQRLHEPTES